jgi:hypothetical protein
MEPPKCKVKGRLFTYNKAGQNEVARGRCEYPPILAIVGDGMSNSFKDDNATKPTMDQVVSVKGDVQERDERVVSASQQEQGDLLSH